ncbi:MAG: carbohydrate binding family 9 domain-containing protein [Deltaproteobacteria bacterium]|nr:carbohydrate binding family 9 domain-containing protein [Deltaproteobacteria bacterium]
MRIPLSILLLAACSPGVLSAQDWRADAVALQADETIAIDGRFDEAAWGRAESITDFFGTQPVEGGAVEAKTEVRVLANDTHVFFGFDCTLADPEERVRGYVAAREDVNRDDQVGVYLDPFGDGRRAYIFYINALGVQQDMVTTIDGYWSGAWDAKFRSAGTHERGRYRVEIAIPWRSIRFPKESSRPWRLRLTRRFGASQAKAAWPPYRQDDGPMLTQFGELHGVQPKKAGIGLELQPSIVVRTGLDHDDAEDKLVWRKPGFPDTVDPSLGIKWQPTPSLTLDATVNPDFSQVEADPNFLDSNLRFPIFLSERRPFFLEGRELFDSHLLYTRAVVNPLYGLKVSGKVKRVTIAVLHALDETPAPSFVQDRATPGFDDVDDDTMAFVTYAGSRLDLPGRSSLGLNYSDRELVRGNEHVGDHHALQLDGVLGIDANSTARGYIGLAETGAVGGERVRGARGRVSVNRSERFGSVNLGASFITPGYRAENGFLLRTDRLSWDGNANLRFEPTVKAVEWVQSGFWMSGSLQNVSAGAERDQGEAGGFTRVRLLGLTELEVWSEGWQTRFSGQNFEGGRIGFQASNRALDVLDISLDASIGDTIRFSDATKSFVRNVRLTVGLRALRRLKLDLSYAVQALGKDADPLEFEQVYRARLRIGFTQALSLRLIAQGSIDERVDLSALFAFQPTAGTAVFVGWGHRFDYDSAGKLRSDAIDLFLKGTVQIRL